MRIGIIGAGNIGGTLGHLWAAAGHDVMFSFARDAGKLERLAHEAGGSARTGSPQAAAQFGDAVLLSVPWETIPQALEEAGPLEGLVLIDTTNPYGKAGLIALPDGSSAAETNARRMPGARFVKAFNTMTAGFLAEAAIRPDAEKAAVFYSGEDEGAKAVAAELIAAAGFVPVDLGGWATVSLQEAPRRPGSVYGEEYRAEAAQLIARAAGRDMEEAAERARTTMVKDLGG